MISILIFFESCETMNSAMFKTAMSSLPLGLRGGIKGGAFIFILAIIFLLITGCTSNIQTTVEATPGDLMPAWFWDTPSINGIQLAVGYSLPHIESEHAYDEAFHDAAWRLFCDKRCRIFGEKGTASSPEGTMQMGSTMRMEVDSTGFSAFSRKLARLDSMVTESMRIMLVATSEVQVDKQRVHFPRLKINGSTGYFGIGAAPLYYHLSSSWIEAEREAREQLAIDAHSELKGTTEAVDEQMLHTIVTKTDVTLSDIQTIHRRIDYINGFVMVWVRGNAVEYGGK